MAIETNTPAQRERLRRVREMLANGENPYATVSPKDQGGLDQDRKVRSIEALKVQAERSESRTKELESKWRGNSGTVNPRVSFAPGSSFAKMFGAPVVLDPEKVCCSFCDNEIDRVNATFGRGKPRKIINTVFLLDEHGNKTFDDDIHHVIDKLVACPDCVNQIKPILDRDGNLVNSGIDFPETEG